MSAVKGEAKKEKVMTLLLTTGKGAGVPAQLILSWANSLAFLSLIFSICKMDIASTAQAPTVIGIVSGNFSCFMVRGTLGSS